VKREQINHQIIQQKKTEQTWASDHFFWYKLKHAKGIGTKTKWKTLVITRRGGKGVKNNLFS